VTQPPHIDGLPLGWQITISLIFGLAALGAAYSGYFKKSEKAIQSAEPQTAAIMAASIMDMGAVRHLADVCIILTGAIDTLTKSVDEHTHHERNSVEISREICARLRELKEELERQGRDQRAWDKRDESRR
jgi:hypothetical protein